MDTFETVLFYTSGVSLIIVVIFILFLLNCITAPYLKKEKIIKSPSFVDNITIKCY